MSTKRRRKAKPKAESLAEPSVWRRQHGGFGPAKREADPETGRPVTRRRAEDVLDRMLANGTITAAMRDAGESFHMAFRAAALDPLRPMPLLRMPGGSDVTPTERAVAARRKVARIMAALGGQDSAAGSCVWHVVGCGMSIREWALRQGWGGRTMGHTQAQGVLVAALGMIAAGYGYQAPKYASKNPKGA
jgi:hypothetical protein